jgi:hypothetical protein
MNRAIPFLAAVVGLIALAGAVTVQLSADARTRQVTEELVKVQAALDALNQRADQIAAVSSQPAEPVDDGTIDAMLALQDRMNKLEEEWNERPLTTASTTTPSGSGNGAFSTTIGGPPAEIDPSWPTTDCIPMGTRFMASVGDEMAICKTPVKVHISAITGDNVMIEGTGVITETAFKSIPGSNCQLTVFSADDAGFAEMRVACQ